MPGLILESASAAPVLGQIGTCDAASPVIDGGCGTYGLGNRLLKSITCPVQQDGTCTPNDNKCEWACTATVEGVGGDASICLIEQGTQNCEGSNISLHPTTLQANVVLDADEDCDDTTWRKIAFFDSNGDPTGCMKIKFVCQICVIVDY